MYGTNPIRFYNSLTHVKRGGVWQSVPKSLGTLVFNIMQLVTPASSEKKKPIFMFNVCIFCTMA